MINQIVSFTDHGPKLTKKFVKFGALPTEELPKKSLINESPLEKTERPARSIVQDLDLSRKQSFFYKDLKDVTARVKMSVITHPDKVHVIKYEVPYILPRCEIIIDESPAYTISVFGWFLPDDHNLYKDFKRSVRCATISDIKNNLESLSICQGHKSTCFSGRSIKHAVLLKVDPDRD